MPNFISEDQIEQELVRRLRQRHGFEVLNCHTADPEEPNDRSGRASRRDVFLVDRVREAAIRLNPTDIPQLYLSNAFCVVSNAIETKVGSFSADWEYFFNWLRPEDEKEASGLSARPAHDPSRSRARAATREGAHMRRRGLARCGSRG